MSSSNSSSPDRKRIRFSCSQSSSCNDTKRNRRVISESDSDEINDIEIDNVVTTIDKVSSSDFSQNIERETSRLSELSIEKSKSDLSESDSENLPNLGNFIGDNSMNNNNEHNENDTTDDINSDTTNNVNSVKNPEEELKSAITKVAILDGKFFLVDFSKSTIKNDIAKCQFCSGEKYYKGSLRATSNFSSHLKLKKNDPANISTVDRKRWSCSYNQEKFEENLTYFVLDSMLPINVVERPSFRQIFDDLQVKKGESQLQHLSRYSLGKRIKTYFDKSFNEIRQHLESVTTNNGFVCTTADVWTSGSRRFLGVTMSWIDQKSLARKSDAVACKRFLGTHSFDAIAKKLFDIHSSFDSSEVSCDDNDEEIFDALDDISVRAEEEFDLTCEIALPQHLRCASHTLNLIATTDISKGIEASQVLKKRHTNVVKKCSSLWKQLRSPKKNEYFKLYLVLTSNKITCPLTTPLSVPNIVVKFSPERDYIEAKERLDLRYNDAETIRGTQNFHSVIPRSNGNIITKEYSSL
ncbi:Protein of unknown function [Cotesia congregata]|uniref:Uncharacterized protein n=1 Tax=Cotesia congregata TaxID=51543 RepID=A0A8J2HEP2_COTCN|nr:Protein of unknown function [Cotesia congregata]